MDELVLEPTLMAEVSAPAATPASERLPPPPDTSHLVTEDDGPELYVSPPDTSHLITEDDTPVDNWFSEKNQRLLAGPVNEAGKRLFGGRPFVAAANVGIFNTIRQPAIVPDVFLSLDADMGEDWWETSGRSYLVWEAGKPPDVVIEIVSNTKGAELQQKRQRYARMRVLYYVVFDPNLQIQDDLLAVFELRGDEYVQRPDCFLPAVGLGLTIWHGEFEGKVANWLRWCDAEGNLILTGYEEAEEERARAEEANTRAEEERARAEEASVRAEEQRTRAERLAAQLRLLGIEPEA
jgi:Uma2 family endonuclease